MRHVIALLVACLFAVSGHAQIPTPSAEQMRHFTRELEQLEKSFSDTALADQFSDRFWRASKRVADRNGPDIIAAVMLRGRKWRGEELRHAIIFMPLVHLLRRDRATAILRAYERSGREPDAMLAEEFMTAFDDEEVQETVRRYSKCVSRRCS